MIRDFRLSADFFDHPKIVKLERRHGGSAVLALVKFYAWVTKHYPGGSIHGDDMETSPLTVEETEQLIGLKLLDREGDFIGVHDWNEHNGYVSNSQSRSWIAKRNAHTGWLTRHGTACPVRGCEFCGIKAGSKRDQSGINAPSPSPSPSPRKKNPSDSKKKTIPTRETFTESESISAAAAAGFSEGFARKQYAAFIDGCAAKGYAYLDAAAAFRSWIRRDYDRNPNPDFLLKSVEAKAIPEHVQSLRAVLNKRGAK